MKKTVFIFCMVLVLLMAVNASADQIFINTPNTDLQPYPAPFASILVNRTDSTHASISVQALSQGTYVYKFGGNEGVDLNTNGQVSVSNLSDLTFNWSWLGAGQQVDGLGQFNLIVEQGNNSNPVTSLTFDLTLQSGSWGTASDVLTLNPDYLAAAHISVFVPGSGDAIKTGFAGGNGTSTIPEPATMFLLGSGLLGLAGLAGRRFRRQ